MKINVEGILTINEIKLCFIMHADDQVLFATLQISLQLLDDMEGYCNLYNNNINTKKAVFIFLKREIETHIFHLIYIIKTQGSQSVQSIGVYFYKKGQWIKSKAHIISVFNSYAFIIVDNYSFSIR